MYFLFTKNYVQEHNNNSEELPRPRNYITIMLHRHVKLQPTILTLKYIFRVTMIS